MSPAEIHPLKRHSAPLLTHDPIQVTETFASGLKTEPNPGTDASITRASNSCQLEGLPAMNEGTF